MHNDPRHIALFVILLVTFSIGPSVMKLTVLPALGLLLPYALRL